MLTGLKLDAMLGARGAALGWNAMERLGSGARCCFRPMKGVCAVPACRDVMDLPFMQLAVAGSAQVLVSGDQDLLTLSCEFEKTFACPIETLDEFLRSRLGV